MSWGLLVSRIPQQVRSTRKIPPPPHHHHPRRLPHVSSTPQPQTPSLQIFPALTQLMSKPSLMSPRAQPWDEAGAQTGTGSASCSWAASRAVGKLGRGTGSWEGGLRKGFLEGVASLQAEEVLR